MTKYETNELNKNSKGGTELMLQGLYDRLDPALIRPGRVDLQVDLGPAVKEQIEELYLKFFPETKRDILNQYVSQCVQEQQVIAKVHQYLINKKFHKDL